MLAAVVSLVAAIWAALHLRTLLLAAVTFLFLADYLKSRRPKNYPPGPRRLPFVGNMLQLDLEQPHLAVQQLVKKYGNVMSLDFGIMSSVIITSLPLIKEAFTQLEENFMSRPKFPIHKHIFKENGLVFASGQTWKEQRRFALMTLKNFGVGKKSIEHRIQEEARHLVGAMKEEKGQPFDPHLKIHNAVSNVICAITFGERFDYHDEQFHDLLRLLEEAMYLGSSIMVHLYNIFPWLMRYIPGSHQTTLATWRELKSYVSNIIDKHRRNWNPDEPKDFIDAFLKEMTKHTDKTTTSFNEENLICSTLDLFLAGTETTSTTMRWALLYMAVYPEIQEKVQAEIDKVIGPKKQPSLNDRDSMPYTNAVVHEVQRMGNIIPLNLPREVTVDTTLAGFYLPKGSILQTNLTALHMDPNEWATPDVFNPEHFLENGEFRKRESFLPFSMGKRACLGEQLARSELFILFTALVQKFTFKPPVNEKLSLNFRMGVTVSPVSYQLRAVPRF
ncbi:cytochrome P450 2J3-like isoform X1 [Microtus oregoni]|uniref:cytochrome P450 2J3-like isoform X1 n=1 Tax=Microtus oregoni TaxID=111838 RepID=UPI001BB1DE75|nr:cytochrome P450 2J3-like isoform X1 [Microtus oregoni]